MKSLRVLFAIGLLLPALTVEVRAMGSGGSKKKVDAQACLVRPEDHLGGGARGSVRLRRQNKKGELVARFDVAAQKVGASGPFELFLEDGVGSGVFENLGDLKSSGKTLEWSADTSKGDALPLDVDALEDLVGRVLQVRADGDVILGATLPELDASKKPVKTKLVLDVPDGSTVPAAKGKLQLRAKQDKGQARFDLKVGKLPFGSSDMHLWIETADGSDVFEDAGEIKRLGKSSNGLYRRDCQKGDPLPAGVGSLAELEGRELQVRADDDEVLLEGEVGKL